MPLLVFLKLKVFHIFKGDTLITSNKRSEDSYLGLADFFACFFFRKKSYNLFTLNFGFSRFDLWFIFKFSAFPLLKRSQNPLSNSKIVKVKKNVIEF